MPNICATIPFVGGTVESHNIPNVIPNKIDINIDGGEKIKINGWVRTFRANRFIALNDGSTIENLQCVIDYENIQSNVLKKINTGAAIQINGILSESKGSNPLWSAIGV